MIVLLLVLLFALPVQALDFTVEEPEGCAILTCNDVTEFWIHENCVYNADCAAEIQAFPEPYISMYSDVHCFEVNCLTKCVREVDSNLATCGTEQFLTWSRDKTSWCCAVQVCDKFCVNGRWEKHDE